MLRIQGFFFLFFSFSAFAHELTYYNYSTLNEIGEKVLELKVQNQGKDELHLKVPERWIDIKKWTEAGTLELSWENCTTDEMMEGRGELTQCIRRAFLSVHGEADNHHPGTLKIQVLKNGRLAASYETRFTPAYDFSFVAKPSTQLENWKSFVATLSALPEKSRFRASSAQKKVREPVPQGISEKEYENRAVGFLLFGDSGTGGSPQYKVAEGIKKYCTTEPCEFVTLLGDNIYEFGAFSSSDSQWQSKFEKPYKELNMPFYPSLGNHDHVGSIQAQIDYSAKSSKWKMPGRYYHYTKGNLDFFAIDSDDFDSTQRKWLEDGLAAAKGRWKFVYGHHPVFSYGDHGDTSQLVNELLPLLKKYKVDFYLCGHDHDKQVLQDSGIGFIVSGASAKLRSVGTGPKSLYSSSTYGFSHMNCNDESCTMRILDQAGGKQFEKVYPKPVALP